MQNTTLLPKNRIASIDVLRGLVMVIMALDHVRDYFHYAAYFFDPTDPSKTTLPIFFTRFITHICAPAFSLLAGISAFLVGQRKSISQQSGFLLKRGLWLIFIELTILTFGSHFDIYFRDVVFETIWALGVSMIFLAGLIRLQMKYMIALSVLIIFGHNLLDRVHFDGSVLWSFIHERNAFKFFPGHGFLVAYPMLPWVAVMSLGYCFGSFYDASFDRLARKKLFNTIGIGAIILFMLLRWTNFYGDLLPWTGYGTTRQSVMSFLDLTKYPPSLDFLLVTLGASLIFLANAERMKGKIAGFFSVFGRVPFFYYVIHIYLIHLLAMFAAGFSGYGWQKMIITFLPEEEGQLKGFGFTLATVYLIWAVVIGLMYPLCAMFDRFKKRHIEKWWVGYV